jgi:hypothetical protein
MFKTRRNIVQVLAVCALLLPTTLIAENPAERPFRLRGNITVVLDLSTMTWEMEDYGEATHFGPYANHGSGSVEDIYLADGEGGGVNTVDNGDQVYWTLEAVDGVWTVTFTGGTGRFTNAMGSFLAVPGEIVYVVDPDLAQITYTFRYTGTGTITY